MLLDLWNQMLIISDVVDYLKEFVEHGSFSFSIFLFLTVVGFVLYFAWQSTDIPDLPPPPHPPYVIQIQANVNTFNNGVVTTASGGRHTLSDVRLLSSGPLVDSVLNRIPPSSSSSSPSSRQHHQTQHHQHTHGRRSALFFGLLRRPSPRPLIHFRPSTRSRFQASNVIVYSQVNVYHTHAGRSDGLPESSSSGTISQAQSSAEASSRSEGSNIAGDRLENSTVLASEANTGAGSVVNSSEFNNLTLSGSQNEETNLTDIEIEADGNTIGVDIVRVNVNNVNVTENRQVGVDVDLNGDVTIVERNSSRSSSNTEASRTGLNATSVSTTNPVAMSSPGVGEEEGIKYGSAGTPGAPPVSSPPAQGPSANRSETEDDVRITLKFLNETQMEVTTQLSEKIADFKRRHFATELSENKVVRLIFNGRVLDNDGKTLQESGIFDQCVVHCLIVTPQTSQQRAGQSQTGRSSSDQTPHRRSLREGPEPGMFFVSVLGIVLIFLWFICFHFGQQLFTQSAVISLVVLTAVFVIGLVALYLPVQSNNN